MNTRIVPCEACQGEGRDIRYGLMYEPGESHPHMGEVDRGPCTVCQGTGSIEIETAPVTLEDLDDMEEGPIDDGRCPCGFDTDRCTPYEGDCLYAPTKSVEILRPAAGSGHETAT